MKKLSAILLILILNIILVVNPAFAAANPPNIYEVKSGDTLPKIADKFDTSIEEIKVSNGLQSDLLFIGQKLRVPFIYEVVDGDTLHEVASTYHSSIPLIKKINGLNSEQLYSGQLLKVPPKMLTMQGQHILMTKEEFKDWLFNNEFNRPIKIIQHHHTWLPSYKQFKGSNHFKMLKSMENFHVNTNGWKNIAQNLTTFPDGKIAVSRPFNIAPEGSIGSKANSVGLTIENVGNFDVGHDVMTKEQKETIVYVTALLCIKFGLTPSIDTITYHHWWDLKTGERVLDNGPDYNVKTCPGTGFFGGNSTQSAQKYFYPLVIRKIDEILASTK